ncbi:MAG TPA: TIGR03000 domain-containing protein [Gemmataceae bacterium]|nr:TIGR03000 domain-containing protein [Gemmataceae bacterium]
MSSNRSDGRFHLVWIAVLLAAGPAESQEASRRAQLHLRLPADAQLTVEGQKTRQTGSLRHFFSPPLERGKSYHYTFEWTYSKDGKTYKAMKVVHVRAGDDREEDLTGEKGKEVGAEEKKPDKDLDPEEKKPSKKPKPKLDVEFVETPPKVVNKMLELAKITKDDVVYDLGCGDGRIVIAAAGNYKCKAVGVDLDDKRVREARAKVKGEGLEDLVTIEKKNFFDVDLKPASVVMLYLTPELNVQLLPQLKKLKAGSRIVSHNFDIKGYPPKRSETVNVDGVKHNVYLWEAPLMKEK